MEDEEKNFLMVSNGLLNFTSSFYHELGFTSNAVFSPFSFLTAFAMTYLGSNGNTALQFEKVFGLSENPEINHAAMRAIFAIISDPKKENAALYVANRIYLDESLEIQQQFLEAIRVYYHSPLGYVDFHDPAQARDTINSWVSLYTEKKIVNLLPKDAIAKDSRIVLVTAMFLRGIWKEAFPIDKTQVAPFHLANGNQVNTITMSMQSTFRLASFPTLNCRLLEMPYQNEQLRFFVLLPNSHDGLDALEKSLNTSVLTSIFKAERKAAPVLVKMPRFRVEGSISPMEPLKRLGLVDLFNKESCDLSGISGSSELVVSAVAHRATIEVNEDGTRATAATFVLGRQKRSVEEVGEEFIADHPFLFFIRDEATGIILFYGRFSEPQQEQRDEL